tara:strand:+ start:873 stop:1556 length:684 start_codon:yes stop_codon:yes gene_type:complete
MSKDTNVKKNSKEWFDSVFNYEYSYHFSWLGRPIIQFPQDMVAIQELIWKIKPDLIIETGIAHGGSLIFSASILEMIGKGEVIGIDIDIRKHNKKLIEKHPMFKRIKMIEGSSVDKSIINKIHKLAKNKKKILVLLDSKHTEKHVLKELKAYSKVVTKGSYIVVFDTIIEDTDSKKASENRPWGIGNNPKTAVWKFLEKNKRFKIDKFIERKLLITSCPDGYLKCIK